MTEEEWLTSTDPQAMCEFVRNATTTYKTRWQGWFEGRRFKIHNRKWQLIEQAVVDRIAECLLLHDHRIALQLAAAVGRHVAFQGSTSAEEVNRATERAKDIAKRCGLFSWMLLPLDKADLTGIVRDILGNPFRRELVTPGWLTSHHASVRRIAEDIDVIGSYHEMPVLADALEEAGCASEVLIAHCRQPTRHVRGCWVVDLLLGRE